MKQALIIDDDAMLRSIAGMIFQRLGYEVSEAANGPEALTLCRRAKPDVILLDWLMPGMSGIDFLNTYAVQLIGRKPLIIYCITEYLEQHVKRALHAGADAYLLKPYDQAAIRQTLDEATRLELLP